MQNNVIKGTTTSGYKYSINSKVLKDWDFLERAEALQNGESSISLLRETLVFLLGEDGFEKLKEHARKSNNGIADVEFMMKAVTDIFENPALKN